MGTEFSSNAKWFAGIIHENCGPQSFNVRLEDGRMVRRHIDHLRFNRVEERPPLNCLQREGHPYEFEFPNPDLSEDQQNGTQGGEQVQPFADRTDHVSLPIPARLGYWILRGEECSSLRLGF